MSRSVTGMSVCSGVAVGPALVYLQQLPKQTLGSLASRAHIPQQQQRFLDAIAHLIAIYEKRLSQLPLDSVKLQTQAQLLEATLLWLDDEDMQQCVLDTIEQYQLTAVAAIDHVYSTHAAEIAAIADPYLASRSHDIRALGQRLCLYLSGQTTDITDIESPVILCCQDLSPGDFMLLDLTNIMGLVLRQCGLTSHTVILARSAGIPCLINCDFIAEGLSSGQNIMIDSQHQQLIIEPEDWRQQDNIAWRAAQLANQARYEHERLIPCQTLDGHAIKLRANVGNQQDIDNSRELQSEGIGLLRTELMFINALSLTDETVQFDAYYQAVMSLQGAMLTIRTLDVGADKPLKAISLGHEDNPALGMRGIRYTLRHQEVLMPQLRALLRAAHFGPISVMFPMLSQFEELDDLLDCLELAKAQLTALKHPFGELRLGLVIETPAAAMMLPALLPKLAFISIGTNDLNQYLHGADRGHPQLSAQFPILNPALLALMNTILQQAQHAGVDCGICGELASAPQATALLMGMGFSEFSVSLDCFGAIKSNILSLRLEDCRDLASSALSLPSLNALTACLNNFNHQAGLSNLSQ
ncbi:phosphoenolpyruvate--protein phosphotransferase [Shewanella sp. SNU WT4]|uniref:phosphoenolpyruvate--protein phosphotransferase n=1 Tax=Shewanella sp. SNU WT4 TaxID=2590015 RepID=UPI00112BC8E5|nr:phosphoenolpyruvate--protein phosphotransferase [Shewanella sp. SNU WT4]QDF66935.1 phosphoenolpyruvate--protein phosphotransferase [Shewanella sp. SNU WT4]